MNKSVLTAFVNSNTCWMLRGMIPRSSYSDEEPVMAYVLPLPVCKSIMIVNGAGMTVLFCTSGWLVMKIVGICFNSFGFILECSYG